MTYCVGLNVEEGLVGLADTLITSGNEVTTQRKVTVYNPPRGTFFVMTSGLRSLRDKTITYFEDALVEPRDCDQPFERLYQVVNLLAGQVRQVARCAGAIRSGSSSVVSSSRTSRTCRSGGTSASGAPLRAPPATGSTARSTSWKPRRHAVS